MSDAKPQFVVLGPGMITQLQVLPSLYHLQRLGVVGPLTVCGTRAKSLKALHEDAGHKRAFPGHSFTPVPDYRKNEAESADAYRKVLKQLPPRQCVVVALPDQERFGILPKGRVLKSPCNRFYLQLIAPIPELLDEDREEMLQRVAFGTPDVLAAVALLRQRGVEFVESAGVHTEPRGALTQARLGGVMFELVQHTPV